MLFLLSTALLFSSAFISTTHALMSCNQTINGTFYDLEPLHALGDIKITPIAGDYNYYINVCGTVSGPCINRSAFACQVKKIPIDYVEAILAYSDVEIHKPSPIWSRSENSTGNVKLQFTNGDKCNERERITNVDFQCDENGTRNITIDEYPQCTFNIIYPTKVVCQEAPTTAAPTTAAPTSSPSSTDENTITRAGLGAGLGIGVGGMTLLLLICWCWNRSRVQRETQSGSGSGYGSV